MSSEYDLKDGDHEDDDDETRRHCVIDRGF
jgi:hypothetical protein